jgi:TfoX/Sxy family transcriptional regulator of competence genes
MAYSKSLAARIRQTLAQRRGVSEKRMFGGVAFLLNGNMLVGVWQDSLIARLGPEVGERALRQPFVRPFDVTGRPMKGWVMIEPDGMDTDVELTEWIDQVLAFVTTLPAK